MTRPRPVHCPRCAADRGVAIPAACPHVVDAPRAADAVIGACAGLARDCARLAAVAARDAADAARAAADATDKDELQDQIADAIGGRYELRKVEGDDAVWAVFDNEEKKDAEGRDGPLRFDDEDEAREACRKLERNYPRCAACPHVVDAPRAAADARAAADDAALDAARAADAADAVIGACAGLARDCARLAAVAARDAADAARAAADATDTLAAAAAAAAAADAAERAADAAAAAATYRGADDATCRAWIDAVLVDAARARRREP